MKCLSWITCFALWNLCLLRAFRQHRKDFHWRNLWKITKILFLELKPCKGADVNHLLVDPWISDPPWSTIKTLWHFHFEATSLNRWTQCGRGWIGWGRQGWEWRRSAWSASPSCPSPDGWLDDILIGKEAPGICKGARRGKTSHVRTSCRCNRGCPACQKSTQPLMRYWSSNVYNIHIYTKIKSKQITDQLLRMHICFPHQLARLVMDFPDFEFVCLYDRINRGSRSNPLAMWFHSIELFHIAE